MCTAKCLLAPRVHILQSVTLQPVQVIWILNLYFSLFPNEPLYVMHTYGFLWVYKRGFWIYLYFRIRHSFAHLKPVIVCWLVNQPIAKLDLFKSPDCCWICKTDAEYCCRSSATVRRFVQSPTLQSTIF